jgi:hypothetical protein
MNFGELKTAIGTWLDKDTNALPDAVRGQIVNMVIQEYCRRFDLRFNEYSADVNAVAGTAYSTLPTGYSRPLLMYYLDTDGNKVDVDYLPREEFIIKYPDPTNTGAVKYYTVWAGKIWWGPTPDTSRTIKFDIYRFLPDLTVEEGTNDFTVYVWPLLLFRSCCLASIFGIEDMRMATWQSEYMKLENQLVIEHSRANSVGRRPVSRDYGYTGREA